MNNQQMNTELERQADLLLQNDEALKKMLDATSPDALMKVFEEYNIVIKDITPQEVFDAFQKVQSDELVEEDLDEISGGVYLMMKTSLFTFAVSGSVGAALCVAGGVAAIGLASYAAYRIIKKNT